VVKEKGDLRKSRHSSKAKGGGIDMNRYGIRAREKVSVGDGGGRVQPWGGEGAFEEKREAHQLMFPVRA